MRLEVSLQARLEQKLRLAPQIIQSIEILQLPALELQDLVKEQLEENPTLEEEPRPEQTEVEKEAQDSLDRELESLERVDAVWNDYFSQPGGRGSSGGAGEDRKREAMENTAAPAVSLQDYLIQQLHLLDVSSAVLPEVREALEAEWSDEVVARIRALAEYIVYNLDTNGYLTCSIEEVVRSYLRQEEGGEDLQEAAPVVGEEPDPAGDGAPAPSEAQAPVDSAPAAVEAEEAAPSPQEASLPDPDPLAWRAPTATPATPTDAAPVTPMEAAPPFDAGNGGDGLQVEAAEPPPAVEPGANGVLTVAAEEALRIVQALDPPGVAGRSLKEVLLLQLGLDPEKYKDVRHIIENHLQDIQSNRFPKIAKALGTDIEEVKERIAFIKMLNPRPGSLFAAKEAHYIIPDVVVVEVDGDYEVRLEDTYIPRLHISPHYRRMLTEERDNPKVREFIKKKIESAKWLIESIEQRQNTLLRISREIVDVQRGFLDYGLEHLRPLKMQHIADRVGVHVSTVSRALSTKYIQTPRGIYPMKFFFTGGTVSQDGTMESTVSIKQKVRDIIEKEDKRHPLSDEDIARILRTDQGLEIARRTVTKYRKQLSIPSSRQRRMY